MSENGEGYRINFIEQMHLFWQCRQFNGLELSATQKAVYQALFMEANHHRWQTWFQCANKKLLLVAGIKSKATLQKCVFTLESAGLISYLPGKDKTTKPSYSIHPITKDNTHWNSSKNELVYIEPVQKMNSTSSKNELVGSEPVQKMNSTSSKNEPLYKSIKTNKGKKCVKRAETHTGPPSDFSEFEILDGGETGQESFYDFSLDDGHQNSPPEFYTNTESPPSSAPPPQRKPACKADVVKWFQDRGMWQEQAEKETAKFLNYNTGKGWPLKWQNAAEVWLVNIPKQVKNGNSKNTGPAGFATDAELSALYGETL